ncbi:MAG TPA: pyridoxamine 5'-phosphate oxidase family protein [Xanthobacteraceae bacterium]|nr:pyridoxamine 5'-phosphate oxidase family protein [Xanthobacteraceae bacterium]
MVISFSPVFETEADLAALYQAPTAGAVAKEIGLIDKYCRRFIELSPFLCIGSLGANGRGDVSPRGGEPGFVHVLDEKHLALPDRPGNNRLDTIRNFLHQPNVGLLFFVPGFDDMLRVNGTAWITTDASLMQRFYVNGRPPLSVIVITVEEAQLHCPKAVRRSGLWDPARHVERRSFPTLGEIMRDQLALKKELSAIEDFLARDALKLY